MLKGKPSNDAIDAVLDRLATDQAFREKMLGDPKSALAEHGIDIDESAIPTTRVLPSMEDIKRNRQEFKDKNCGELGFSRFFLR